MAVLSNKTLRVAVHHFDEVVQSCVHGTLKSTPECIWPGIFTEVLDVLLSDFKGLEIIDHVVDVNWGERFPNGTYTGIYKEIAEAEIYDITVLPYVITQSRMRDFDFAYPTLPLKTSFIMAKRSETVLEAGIRLLNIFPWDVWMLILIVYMTLFSVATVAVYMILSEQTDASGPCRPALRYLYNCSRFIQRQADGDLRQRAFGGNVTFVLTCFLTVIFTELFTTLMVATFQYRPSPPIVKDAADLLEKLKSNELKLIIMNENFYFAEFIKAANVDDKGFFPELKRLYLQNMLVFEPNQTKVLDMVRKGNYVFSIDARRAAEILHKDCDLISVSNDQLPILPASFMLRKGSKWTEFLTQRIINRYGTMLTIEERYNWLSMPCFEQLPRYTNDQPKALTLHSYSALFMLMLCAFSIAFVGFCCELII